MFRVNQTSFFYVIDDLSNSNNSHSAYYECCTLFPKISISLSDTTYCIQIAALYMYDLIILFQHNYIFFQLSSYTFYYFSLFQ